MDISFANPAGFWALLALPAVLAIHFLQRESRRVVTSTLFLFDQLAPVSAQGSRFERLRSSLPLWLQIAAVLLLTWLLVGPRWVRRDSTQRIVVVLDSSVSMLPFRDDAVHALQSRLPRLASAAGTTEWRLLETDTARPTLYAGGDVHAALDALARWQPRLGTHDFTPALRTAQSLARGTGLTLFVTDHHADLPDGVALLAVGHPLDNCGFAGLSVEDDTWHALVKNYAATPQTRSWHLEAAGAATAPQTFTLESGQTRTLSGPFPAAQTRCELVLSGDDFPLDDRLPIVRPQSKPLAVALQPGTPLDAFLTRLAASIPDAAPVPAIRADVRLAVNDPAVPGPALIFSTQDAPATDFLTGNIVAENHPLTADLAWNGLLVRDTLPIFRKPDDEVLLWQGERPLIFLRGGSPHRSLFVNFDLLQSNADRLPAFVVLLTRFVETIRAEKVAPERLNVETDERLAIASDPAGGLLVNSDGASPTRAPMLPGFFTVSQNAHPLLTGAAYFSDPREADFHEAATEDTLQEKFAPLTERHRHTDFLAPVWALLLGAACLWNWLASGGSTRA